jgi:hypothetical protein
MLIMLLYFENILLTVSGLIFYGLNGHSLHDNWKHDGVNVDADKAGYFGY